MELGFSSDISRTIHILSFNYYQMFHEWNAIYIDLFKEFQTTLKVFEKKKATKIQKSHF